MTEHTGEQRAALVDRAGADASLQPVRLPCTEQRNRDLTKREVIEPWRDVDGVRVGVSLPSRLRESDAVFECLALCDPLAQRRTTPRAVSCWTASGPSCRRRATSRSHASASFLRLKVRLRLRPFSRQRTSYARLPFLRLMA